MLLFFLKAYYFRFPHWPFRLPKFLYTFILQISTYKNKTVLNSASSVYHNLKNWAAEASQNFCVQITTICKMFVTSAAYTVNWNNYAAYCRRDAFALQLPYYFNSTHLCAFLSISLALSGDIETNPGPKTPKFPCRHCNKACCEDKGTKSNILWESCNTWYHAVCVNIDTCLFSVLEWSSCPWECPNCGLSNFSATLIDSVILDYDITLTSSEESPCSTPPPTPLFSPLPSKNMQPIQSHASNLRNVTINFQSVCAKKEDVWTLTGCSVGCCCWLA